MVMKVTQIEVVVFESLETMSIVTWGQRYKCSKPEVFFTQDFSTDRYDTAMEHARILAKHYKISMIITRRDEE